jgi:hypothetical protein
MVQHFFVLLYVGVLAGGACWGSLFRRVPKPITRPLTILGLTVDSPASDFDALPFNDGLHVVVALGDNVNKFVRVLLYRYRGPFPALPTFRDIMLLRCVAVQRWGASSSIASFLGLWSKFLLSAGVAVLRSERRTVRLRYACRAPCG